MASGKSVGLVADLTGALPKCAVCGERAAHYHLYNTADQLHPRLICVQCSLELRTASGRQYLEDLESGKRWTRTVLPAPVRLLVE